VNQDILNLYKRAQNGGLNAQEVFWLEGQAATHPCFGMAYAILARHHYRNQSTIKNRALLKAAAYANNRTLLRHYLEDTLSPPKQRPVPVAEMRPVLERKDAAEATKVVDLQKKNSEAEVVTEAPQATADLAAVSTMESGIETTAAAIDESTTGLEILDESTDSKIEIETLAQSASDIEQVESVAEVTVNEAPVAEIETEAALAVNEAPVAEIEAVAALAVNEAPVAEIEAEAELAAHEGPVAEIEAEAELAVNEAPVAEIEAEAALAAHEAPVAEIEAVAELAAHEGPVAEIEAEAALAAHEAPVAEIETEAALAVNEAPVAEAAPVPFVGKVGDINWFLNMRIRLRTDKHLETTKRLQDGIAKFGALASANADSPQEPILQQASIVTESVHVPLQDAPVVEVAAPVVELVDQQLATDVHAEAPTTPLQLEPVLQQSTASAEKPVPSKEKITRQVSEKQYEIGAFSSFTFLSESESEEAEDVMDTSIHTLESVEFKRGEGAHGNGEIIFEENDRIVEITVSPQALDKYFKGRLPSEPALTFGEFKIELDEHEYKAAELGHAQSKLQELPSVVETSEAESVSSEESVRETMSFEMLDRDEDTPTALHKDKIEAIIDRFIENEPGITRAKSVGIPTGDLAKQSSQLQDGGWVTETLAKIYEKQGNKSKAIKIYEQLRLRLPEKNDYFVSLIEKLKH
jgi:hypothetical protein